MSPRCKQGRHFLNEKGSKNLSLSTRAKQAWRRGLSAESATAWFVRLKGYVVLEQRFKTPLGEIDLVLQQGRTIVFVEVKLRRTLEQASESILIHQQKRIFNAARWFLNTRPKFANYPCRFDAILWAPYTWPKHIKNAWNHSE